MRLHKTLIILGLVAVCGVQTHAQVLQSPFILDTAHNMSVSGRGSVTASSEQGVCIFCHAAHNSTLISPLWNRNTPVETYTVYSSTSLDASPGQPTGSSKMCLSCHDGTIALGDVVSRAQPIAMTGPLGSASNLGTNLADDHPISFPYDSALASADPTLEHPSNIPPVFKLGINDQLQCMTCHDPHDNSNLKFLVMDNTNGQLCTSCHIAQSTAVTAHENCVGCHQVHSAPSGPLLLSGASVGATCTNCHDGTVSGAANIAADLAKFSVHDTGGPVDPRAADNVGCSDCHEPHTMSLGAATTPPDIHPNFGDIDGVNGPAPPTEFEVCYKCHAETTAVYDTTGLYTPTARVITQYDTSLEFDPAAISFHPVEAVGNVDAADMPSLVGMPYLVNSRMYCSDCHASDNPSGPNGVHGSDTPPLLLAPYTTGVVEDVSDENNPNALCFRCHSQTSIFAGESFSKHVKHAGKGSCSICHDPHGINSAQGGLDGTRLINFDLRVVEPLNEVNPVWVDTSTIPGVFSGSCNLKCHGLRHRNKSY